jgi:hypothetical protein
VRCWRWCERTQQRQQHEALVHRRAISVPECGTNENGELKEEEKKTYRSHSTCLGTRRCQAADVSAQVESAASLRNDREVAQHDEGYGEHGPEHADTTMNWSPPGRHERSLGEEEQKPRSGHKGVQCHERRQWQGHVPSGLVDERGRERTGID